MNRTFDMKLRKEPFDRIRHGAKTIEYRLNDEKRSLLRIGDYIRFTEIINNDNSRIITVRIEDIILAPTFTELKEKLILAGMLGDEPFYPKTMRKYYSLADEKRYGVMGIKIKHISNMDRIIHSRKHTHIYVGVSCFPHSFPYL